MTLSSAFSANEYRDILASLLPKGWTIVDGPVNGFIWPRIATSIRFHVLITVKREGRKEFTIVDLLKDGAGLRTPQEIVQRALNTLAQYDVSHPEDEECDNLRCPFMHEVEMVRRRQRDLRSA